jgi:hypothetical protein
MTMQKESFQQTTLDYLYNLLIAQQFPNKEIEESTLKLFIKLLDEKTFLKK